MREGVEEMSMGECKECVWWSKDDIHNSEESSGRNVCDAIPHIYGEGTTDDSLAVASDTEGYHAHLETRPEFGCVLFKSTNTKSCVAE